MLHIHSFSVSHFRGKEFLKVTVNAFYPEKDKWEELVSLTQGCQCVYTSWNQTACLGKITYHNAATFSLW